PQVVGPLELSRLHSTSDIALVDLPTYARMRVEDTITVATLAEAESRVADLRAELDDTTDPPADGEAPTPDPTDDATEGASP
ncbi:MAG TPA: hypothetical protein VK024_05310, partial [Actinomycetaceae bacterium]|nr:hypothetical protein [Actinomycetaceae bacterium]